jgi:hypothetical protein
MKIKYAFTAIAFAIINSTSAMAGANETAERWLAEDQETWYTLKEDRCVTVASIVDSNDPNKTSPYAVEKFLRATGLFVERSRMRDDSDDVWAFKTTNGRIIMMIKGGDLCHIFETMIHKK